MSAANGANGTIDEFRICSLVLEPDEIEEVIEAGSDVELAGQAATTWAELKEKRGKRENGTARERVE